MSFIAASPAAQPDAVARRLYGYGQALIKEAEATISYDLAGMLYLNEDGWLSLSVPTPLVRGVFDALHAVGAEPFPGKAAIPVMSEDEVAVIGADNITERGHAFRYTLGRLYEVEAPEPGIAKIWVVKVHSPELQSLRNSYGLSSLPENDATNFYVPVARLKRGVLGRNDTAKGNEPQPKE